MYAACLFCTRPLGTNAALDAFPVGRRLAYDPARGRLWVVCPHCARWNLSPLEQRWEAIEQAERLARATPLRASTGEIGLARVRAADGEAVDLVRIGRPLLPELAAWRYGDRFGARRRRALLVGGAATLAGGAALAGAASVVPLAAALGAVPSLAFVTLLVNALGTSLGVGRFGMRPDRWVADGAGGWLLVSRNALPFVRLAAGGAAEGGFRLVVPHDRRTTGVPGPSVRDLLNGPPAHQATLTGAPALEAARRLLPIVNGTGASPRHVRDAVAVVEGLGDPATAFAAAARQLPAWSTRQTFGDTGALLHLPAEARLALEMVAHEAQERRALDGELAELEAAWREAEAIAVIADALALPAGVERAHARLRASLPAGHADAGAPCAAPPDASCAAQPPGARLPDAATGADGVPHRG